MYSHSVKETQMHLNLIGLLFNGRLISPLRTTMDSTSSLTQQLFQLFLIYFSSPSNTISLTLHLSPKSWRQSLSFLSKTHPHEKRKRRRRRSSNKKIRGSTIKIDDRSTINMEDHQHHNYNNRHVDATRPSLGFPLGTALLLVIIFFLSGIFSCCYHWEKLRSLRRRSSDLESNAVTTSSRSSTSRSDSSTTYHDQNIHTKPTSLHPDWKQEKQGESLPVIMPGDEAPRFMALPCPCEPAIGAGGGGGSAIMEIGTSSANFKAQASSSSSSLSSSLLSSSYSNLLVCNHIARLGVYYNC